MTVASRIFIVVIFSGAIFAAPAHAVNCAKKPDHPQCQPPPPPPPPPADDGAACVDSDGVFPAFAYKTETTTGERRKQKTTTDIFVANSSGECSIKLYTANYAISEMDYTQRADGIGRIVWRHALSDTATIRMLNFSVADRAITSSLPGTASSVHTEPGIHARIDVSDDGNTILYTDDRRDSNDQVLWRLSSADVSNCASNCPTSTIIEVINGSIGLQGLTMNADGSRIYFSEPGTATGLRRVAFMEMQNGLWVGPTDVVTNEDPAYANRSFRELDVTAHSSGAGEIVAVHYEENGVQTAVKIIGTGGCSVDPMRIGSCYAAGLSTEIGHVPFLAVPTFTDIPYGNTDAPSLTIQTFDNGNWIFYNADLDTFDLALVPGMPNERLAIGK